MISEKQSNFGVEQSYSRNRFVTPIPHGEGGGRGEILPSLRLSSLKLVAEPQNLATFLKFNGE